MGELFLWRGLKVFLLCRESVRGKTKKRLCSPVDLFTQVYQFKLLRSNWCKLGLQGCGGASKKAREDRRPFEPFESATFESSPRGRANESTRQIWNRFSIGK